MKTKRHTHARQRALLLALAALVVILGAALALALRQKSGPRAGGLQYEANVVLGELPGKDPAQRRAELQAAVDRSKVAININATPCLSLAGGGQANWLIENPASQHNLIRVEVERADTGEVIYATGAMRPGTYLENAAPSAELTVGEYACTAWFYTYDPDTEEELGKAGAQITLVVQE